MSLGVIKQSHVTVASTSSVAAIDGLPTTGKVSVQISGTGTWTVDFLATVDGTNWVAFNMTPAGTTTDANQATAAGLWSKDITGYEGFKAKCSARTSGSPVVTVRYVSN